MRQFNTIWNGCVELQRAINRSLPGNVEEAVARIFGTYDSRYQDFFYIFDMFGILNYPVEPQVVDSIEQIIQSNPRYSHLSDYIMFFVLYQIVIPKIKYIISQVKDKRKCLKQLIRKHPTAADPLKEIGKYSAENPYLKEDMLTRNVFMYHIASTDAERVKRAQNVFNIGTDLNMNKINIPYWRHSTKQIYEQAFIA